MILGWSVNIVGHGGTSLSPPESMHNALVTLSLDNSTCKLKDANQVFKLCRSEKGELLEEGHTDAMSLLF